MPFWPFRRSQPEPLSAEELRVRLIEAAASGSPHTLRKVCKRYRNQVAEHVDFLRKAPEEVRANPAEVERYVQCLGAVAHCLAHDCGAPELWDALCGPQEDNPLVRWEKWYASIPERTEQLEFDELIAESGELLEEVRRFQGTAARLHESYVLGRLGELLFHSGRSDEAIGPFRGALALCEANGDAEGRATYLRNFLEVRRYQGDVAAAIEYGEELLGVLRAAGQETSRTETFLELMQRGEPLCRIVCAQDGREFELDEIASISDGRYQFFFQRNRIPLRKCELLVARGNELASQGQLADALEEYQRASDVDPYDPSPAYQSGVALIELGAYGQATASFEEVERLAPGWYHVRSNLWWGRSLEEGTVDVEQFQVLRALEDGGLPADQALSIAQRANEQYPDFAPFQLVLGNLHRDRGETDEAAEWYRCGLQNVDEPDLESRLLCALAATMPESPERTELAQRVIELPGNLVARAMATLLMLR